MKTIEAEIDENGQIRLSENVPAAAGKRAIVVILDEGNIPESALLSEVALAEDWNRPEEEAAWAHLQSAE
jgi:hypothetical protein